MALLFPLLPRGFFPLLHFMFLIFHMYPSSLCS
uniref:Uncharacterized protein n=1 Tax=Arundo donax TaxID=35708 RepID=A0A0A9F7U2_ARUDO